MKRKTDVIEPIVDNKPWYKSKTKLGAILTGVSIISGAVAGYLSQTIDIITAVQSSLLGIGLVLASFGIRNKLEEIIK